MISLPREIRDDSEIWRYFEHIFSQEKASKIFNPKSRDAQVLRKLLTDLCAYLQGVMGGLEPEERYPMCRKCVMHALGRIATAERPAAYGQWQLKHSSISVYIGEDLLDQCRRREREIRGKSGPGLHLLGSLHEHRCQE